MACLLFVVLLAGAVAGVLAIRKVRRAPVLASASAFSIPGRATAWPLPKLWRVPSFSFPGADGRTTGESTLRGHVWIADFIFTRCVTMCPIITAEMNVLRRSLVSREMRFVSFSVEPDYDTPAVLKAYATTWGADPRWLLLSPPAGQVIEFAKAMNVPFEHTSMPDEPILHTTLFFLVDREGWVRGAYGSLDAAAVRGLAVDAARLEANGDDPMVGSHPPPSPEQQPTGTPLSRGQVLFRALGCGACHDMPKLGPSLAGLAGRSVTLEGEATVVADDAYLRQSILDPAERVVAGYNVLMPAYRDQISAADVEALVVYLHSLDSPIDESHAASTPEADTVEVQDPVCGMRMKPARAATHVAYQGKSWYFCSERCRDRFVQEPARYAH